MNFTPDGYTEPLSPRPAGFAAGGLILLLGVGAVVAGWFCLGSFLVVVGGLTALNETGTQRIRITRSKILIEHESRVRGLLIGPRRMRTTWTDVTEVTLEADCIKVVSKDGTVLLLGQGGPKVELTKLKNRIEQSRKA